ncbi:hypothetical protein [Ornithinimicrobium murale]|uniref:hypothetical protein n=1 Tax=Ornithinimicrobium murale TaxID=1050153 RepID=UPI000E0DB185|nr:hypothetical protein [Ornithinimicrobium murale]
MTHPSVGTFTPSAEAVRILTRIAMLLDQATREAADLRRTELSLRTSDLGLEAMLMWAETVAMLPGQTYPEVEVVAVGKDPVALFRQAERLSAELPIEQFPRGMSQLIVRLIVAIRDLA